MPSCVGIYRDIDPERLRTEKMFPKHLTWIFLGLFFLFGIFMLMAQSASRRQIWAGLSVLSVGSFVVSVVKDALTTGQIQMEYSAIYRATQPWGFWASVIIFAVGGTIALIGGVWILFFKN
jgi:hypothetical protein